MEIFTDMVIIERKSEKETQRDHRLLRKIVASWEFLDELNEYCRLPFCYFIFFGFFDDCKQNNLREIN